MPKTCSVWLIRKLDWGVLKVKTTVVASEASTDTRFESCAETAEDRAVVVGVVLEVALGEGLPAVVVELHGGGVECRAVVELHAGAQLECVGLAVGARGGQSRREDRDDLADRAGLEAHEALDDLGRHVERVAVAGQSGIGKHHVAVETDDEGPAGRGRSNDRSHDRGRDGRTSRRRRGRRRCAACAAGRCREDRDGQQREQSLLHIHSYLHVRPSWPIPGSDRDSGSNPLGILDSRVNRA